MILGFWKTFTAAAISLGVSREAVRKWQLNGVPAERVREICAATNWTVTPHALRPDLFPNATDAMPISEEKAA